MLGKGELYFNHSIMGRFVLEKRNLYPEYKIEEYLAKINLPRPFFEPIYKKCNEYRLVSDQRNKS